MVTVIDGRNLIHGRLASVVAERIMDGEEIVVLNAEAIVITGVKENVFADFKAKVDRGDTTKRKGPFYPRRADLLFKRCGPQPPEGRPTGGSTSSSAPPSSSRTARRRGPSRPAGRSPANTRPWEPFPNSWVPT